MKALIFPGQGSQSVGMGKDLAETFPCAKAVFDEVDAALGERLSTLMFEGPDAELTLTANAQPALMAVSMAVIRVLQAEGGFEIEQEAAFVAGHSLGEYSALTAAGAFSVSASAQLLRRRGQAMQQAVPPGRGAMAALLGIEAEAAASVAADAERPGEICQVANDNGGGQVVLSGDAAAVQRAIELAKSHGVKRAILLPVSAPFHCDLMRPAAEAVAVALDEVAVESPIVPVVANVTAAPVTDPAALRRLLVEQVTARVRWRESLVFMAGQGVDTFVECGAGKVLSGLVKRVASQCKGTSLSSAADLKAFLARGGA